MKKVNKLVIVGGGTAGWITASWFSRRWGSKIDVTIIDKYQPERVGVGEATLLSFPSGKRPTVCPRASHGGLNPLLLHGIDQLNGRSHFMQECGCEFESHFVVDWWFNG